MLLQNRNAIIYGAGGSLGGAVAKALAGAGARVFLTGRNLGSVRKVADEILADSGRAEVAHVDAFDEQAISTHMEAVVQTAGAVDISFNAVGVDIIQNIPLIDISMDDFVRPVTLTMQTRFLTAKAAARVMIKQGSGTILFILTFMENLSNIGRVFYGTAMAAMGFLTIYYKDFPYMLIPPKHSWMDNHVILVYISGTLLFMAGVCIVLRKKAMLISLLLGSVLLLIFCFYFIPYEFMASSNFIHFYEWENADKELALASGAFVIAGCFSEKSENPLIRFLRKLVPLGVTVFSLTIISFGINHFLYAKEAADYIQSWMPDHLFWIYFAGVALIGSGIAIILKIKLGLAAALLGTMIFIWVIILHIPKAIAAPIADNGGEVTSAFLALAYCGIAFVIAGDMKMKAS